MNSGVLLVEKGGLENTLKLRSEAEGKGGLKELQCLLKGC